NAASSPRPVIVGDVSEPNAHAAAIAAAHQIANEVLNGERPSVSAPDLDTLEKLLRDEAANADRRRRPRPFTPLLMSNTRVASLPLTVSLFAPSPSMSRLLSITSSPEVSVMV